MSYPPGFTPANFKKSSSSAIENDNLYRTLNHALTTTLAKRKKSVQKLPQWESMRNAAHEIKTNIIENLDYYLENFIEKALSKGIKVYCAETANNACEYIVQLALKNSARLIAKSKSMMTEEIKLNSALEKAGLEVVETDLGEFIAQLVNYPPSHIIAPIIHLNRQEVGKIFENSFNLPYTDNPAEITSFARNLLREKFFNADIGISGVNFAISSTGSIVILENEGNARMVTTVPRAHVAVMGIEKLIPTLDELPLFLRLLSVSGTGQMITNYVSVINSARRPNDMDGPEELHVVIVDNGRTRILADPETRQILHCIRCGACLNVCPVYSRVGGHSYGSVYTGPMGSILTPLLDGFEKTRDLPFASTLCGRCSEICPVKIELHHLLLLLRNRIVENNMGPRSEKLGIKTWQYLMKSPRLYRYTETITRIFQHFIPGKNKLYMPSWSKSRDFPKLASKSFHEITREMDEYTNFNNNSQNNNQ